jgi:hypothetical protein
MYIHNIAFALPTDVRLRLSPIEILGVMLKEACFKRGIFSADLHPIL